MARTPKKGFGHKKKITIGKSVVLKVDKTPKLTLNQKVKKINRMGAPRRIDQWQSGGSIPSAGLLLSNLGNITFDDDASNLGTRQVTKVFMKHFRSRGTFSVNSIDKNNRVRILLLRSKTGKPFNLAEVMYEGANPPTLPIDGYVNERNFDVVSDIQYLVQTNEEGSTRNVYKYYNKVVKLNQIAKYNEMPSGQDEQPINKGAQLYHVAFSDSANLPHPSYRTNNQVSFYNN